MFLNYDYKYLSCVPGVDGKIHPEGVVQHRRWRCLLSHRLAARSPRDEFSHPHQERMIDTFSCIFYFILIYGGWNNKQTARPIFMVKPERSDITFNNIVTSRQWAIVFTKNRLMSIRDHKETASKSQHLVGVRRVSVCRFLRPNTSSTTARYTGSVDVITGEHTSLHRKLCLKTFLLRRQLLHNNICLKFERILSLLSQNLIYWDEIRLLVLVCE